MIRRLLLVAVVAVLLTALGVGVAGAAGNNTVKTAGDEILTPNVGISVTLRFVPGPISIRAGDSITWIGDDRARAPHTVTLTRNRAALVRNFGDFLFGTCPVCDAAQGAALAGHFPEGLPPVLELGTDDGFGDDGDSVLFGDGFPNSTTQTLTNVTPGETINYFCSIHPWMQGEINVRR
jgi:plastocyanin